MQKLIKFRALSNLNRAVEAKQISVFIDSKNFESFISRTFGFENTFLVFQTWLPEAGKILSGIIALEKFDDSTLGFFEHKQNLK